VPLLLAAVLGVLLAYPRVQLDFTPTYSSWISQVEQWVRGTQRRCLDHDMFCSLDDLTTALEDWIKNWNASARPFKWTKTADHVIDRICRHCSRISGWCAARILASAADLRFPLRTEGGDGLELDKDAELPALRHENTVLGPHAGRIRCEPADRIWFAALTQLIPACAGLRSSP